MATFAHRYWLANWGKPTDADAFEVIVSIDVSDDPSMLAEFAADDFHNDPDGWEATWPITFIEIGRAHV